MAGLIPRQFIDELLDRVDIVEIVDRRVALKKAGRNYVACCPFHDEKTPSFSVNPDKQFYYCFGCGAGGNSIGFIMDYENTDFPAAVESLAALAGLEVPRETSLGKEQYQQQKNKSQSLYDTLAWAARYYKAQLRQHTNKSQAIEYLKQRGLSGEVARDFAIGYAPPGWDNLLNALDNDDSKPQHMAQLEACGMLVKKENGDYYDRFRERIIFPIRDNRGRVIAFGGRVLNDDKPKYLNSPETAVFHKQRELYGLYEARKANRNLDHLLLVEGYMDVVSLVQYGITNAVATLGTASSSYHLEKIFRHTSKLVVCFDGDEAGEKAAHRLLETALPAMRDGREVCFLFLPDGEDPDTYVREQGKDAFSQLVEQATPLEVVLFDAAAKGINLDSGAGKAKLSKRALPMIQQLPPGVFRQLMLSQLAEKTGADIELLTEEAAKLKPATTPDRTRQQPDQDNPASTAEARAEKQPGNKPASSQSTAAIGLEKTPIVWAIALLLHYPEFANDTELPEKIAALQTDEAQLLVTLFQHIRSQQQKVVTHTLLGYWHGTAEGLALNHCANRHETPDQESIARQELNEVLAKIDADIEEHKLDQFIAELGQRPPSALSEDERNLLKSIGSYKK